MLIINTMNDEPIGHNFKNICVKYLKDARNKGSSEAVFSGYSKVKRKDREDIRVVLFSTGASSALVAWWLLENTKDYVLLYFTDTKIEDEDNYRFRDELLIYFNKHYPERFMYIEEADGRTPKGVFHSLKILGNNFQPVCSRYLKQRMGNRFITKLRKAGFNPIIHLGYDAKEGSRMISSAKFYETRKIQTFFPLATKEFLQFQIDNGFYKSHQAIKSLTGVEPPRMYALGFRSANCGGRCIRMSESNWLHLLITWRDRYIEMENTELEFQTKFDNQHTYLTSKKTLRQIREEFESKVASGEIDVKQEKTKLEKYEMKCVHCTD